MFFVNKAKLFWQLEAAARSRIKKISRDIGHRLAFCGAVDWFRYQAPQPARMVPAVEATVKSQCMESVVTLVSHGGHTGDRLTRGSPKSSLLSSVLCNIETALID